MARHYGPHGEAGRTDVTVFIEVFAPPPRMLIFGAVDFTAALVRVAKVLGYHVTVCDARPVFATSARFPEADEVVADWPHRHLAKVADRLGPGDAICVLTHDHKFDIPALVAALKTKVGYIGAMGSRGTHDGRVERLRAEGVDPDDIRRIMAPIGLDIGARTPEETAVSICAEIISLRAGAGHRRSGTAPARSIESPHDRARTHGCPYEATTGSPSARGQLPVDDAWRWVGVPDCGGIVTFCGTVRDHSDGRPGVTSLEYEAYEEHVVPRLTDVATPPGPDGRKSAAWCSFIGWGGSKWERWRSSSRHRPRTGPRRSAAAQFCIDTLKHTVPIWKRETWEGGSDWSVCTPEGAAPMPDRSLVRHILRRIRRVNLCQPITPMIPLEEAQRIRPRDCAARCLPSSSRSTKPWAAC